MLKNGEIALVLNTPSGKTAREDEVKSAAPRHPIASR
jgi:hypothetical protein